MLTFVSDHQVIFSPYLASEESDTLDSIVRMEEPAFTSMFHRIRCAVNLATISLDFSTEWQKTGKGLMAHKYAYALCSL